MEKQHKLRLINGQFMRGKEVEKPEFGNPEQIKLLKEYENLLIEYREGVLLEPDFEEVCHMEMELCFRCVCGSNIYTSEEIECDRWGDLEHDPDDFKTTCSCGIKYEGRYDKEEKAFNVKFIEKNG